MDRSAMEHMSKVRTIEAMATLMDSARADGQSIVLAHGVFDLLHMGHVRHLKTAKKEGDILVVSITADAFVNKGPGRPIFSHDMRAEMLAALECVDFVAINHMASAEPMIEAVKPDVYVKGSDYENADEDITGKITDEQLSVERHDGRVMFTKDITFSSSSLINHYLDVYDAPLRDYLNELRQQDGLNRCLELIEAVKDMRVVIIGDTIIDEYKYVTPLGKPSKENIIAVQFENGETFAGGVIAAAKHVASFCGHVDVITSLGKLDSQEDLIRTNLEDNINLNLLYRNDAPTTRKTRYIDTSYMGKLFEVYDFKDHPPSAEGEENLRSIINDKIKDADLVIVTDFGHGLITQDVIADLCEKAPFLAVNVQTNAGNHGFNFATRYPRADFVCIDTPEARLAVSDKYADVQKLISELLPEKIDCDRFIITLGLHGSMTYQRESGKIHRIPAITDQVVDTVGAGDAFFAVAAPLVRASGSVELAAFLGNVAGAIKVGIVGHRKAVDKITLTKFINAVLK
ncbi:MAG: adenylyltransferase/cytidyltransferase family protein [Rhodospirillales bacterium]|nr:adenylyltransferase/cytidyltransferase family protein [Rhodospirillales bacterium]